MAPESWARKWIVTDGVVGLIRGRKWNGSRVLILMIVGEVRGGFKCAVTKNVVWMWEKQSQKRFCV